MKVVNVVEINPVVPFLKILFQYPFFENTPLCLLKNSNCLTLFNNPFVTVTSLREVNHRMRGKAWTPLLLWLSIGIHTKNPARWKKRQQLWLNLTFYAMWS